MSNCQNCYNGCTETVSDQCVRYTGIDVPVLGISTGDPLPVIENALITFLTSTLTGVGVKIDLSSIDVCAVVQQYLPTCGELNILELSKALVQASCNIQEQIDVIVAELAILNADYTIPVGPSPDLIPCLSGVTDSSDTHAIVQAVIEKLCSVSADVDSLNVQLPLYVLESELCTLVDDCINNNTVTALASNKMLPYSVVPYYGPPSGYPTVSDGFNSTGAGYGYWLNVYLCNGGNPGVPDLRGRVAVGATDMATAPWPTSGQTQPGVNNNPTYDYKQTTGIQGNNFITLTLPQIPTHTHAATSTVVINDPGHSHEFLGVTNSSGDGNGSRHSVPLTRTTSAAFTGLKGTGTGQNVFVNVSNDSQGQGQAHSNVQPGIAVYYLIYIPA